MSDTPPVVRKINVKVVGPIVVGLVLLVSLIIWGVVGSNTKHAARHPAAAVSYPPLPSSPAATTTPSSSGAPSASSGFTAVHAWSWHIGLPGGYEQSGKLGVGALVHAGDASDVKGVPSSSVSDCSGYDPQTTAVIPFSLDLTNDVNFSQSVSVKFAQSPSDSGPVLSMAIVYSGADGVSCTPIGDAAQGGLWSAGYQLGPNASINTEYGFVVLANYYSPEYPDGNAAALANTIISMPLSYRQDGSSLEQFSGSGIPGNWVQTVIPPGQLGEFPLAGRFS